jgi:uncharacterized protein
VRLIRRTFQLLLLVQDTPRRTALAFAVGVFLGFSPLLGAHTLLALLVAYLFRLSKIGLLIGVYLNNPWVIVPYYGFATWFGVRLTGVSDSVALPHVGFRELFSSEFWRELLGQYELLLPALLGSTVLSVIFALFAYGLALHALQKFDAARHTARNR